MKNLLYIGNHLSEQRTNISASGVLGPKLAQEGYRLTYASSKSHKGARLLDMLWTCLSHRKKVDVVLIDTYSTQNFYYALLVSQLCRVLGVPYIPVLHGGNLPQRLKQSPKLCRAIFNHAYKLVSPSVYLKEAFATHGYHNIHYIPNSLELELYAFEEKNLEEVNLLWVRSFSSIYNPTLAVHILKALLNQGIPANLCMVGPDSDGSIETVKQLAKDLNVPVRFTGKLPKKEWLALAKEYNIFINTTNFDNMPVSVMEAMALGLPIVSTNVGGLPYLIDHEKDGLLVEPDSVDGFVGAIKRLIENPEIAREMAVCARRKVAGFDWEVVKLRWFEVLEGN